MLEAYLLLNLFKGIVVAFYGYIMKSVGVKFTLIVSLALAMFYALFYLHFENKLLHDKNRRLHEEIAILKKRYEYLVQPKPKKNNKTIHKQHYFPNSSDENFIYYEGFTFKNIST